MFKRRPWQDVSGESAYEYTRPVDSTVSPPQNKPPKRIVSTSLPPARHGVLILNDRRSLLAQGSKAADAMHQRALAAGVAVRPPEDKFYGIRVLQIVDPESYTWGLMQRAAFLARAPLTP